MFCGARKRAGHQNHDRYQGRWPRGAERHLHRVCSNGNRNEDVILNKVVPVSRSTTTVGTTGSTTTTTTTYALVPDQKVELETHVGHKVEVTGMMIPAGDSKTTTTTKIERDNAPDSKTKETVKTDNDYPQFRVLSVKNLADKCESD